MIRKSRGLTKEGKWVYGWYIETFWSCENKICSTICPDEFESHHQLVVPETVGMSTGLKDKNGKEIYEGDIVASGTLHLEIILKNRTIKYKEHIKKRGQIIMNAREAKEISNRNSNKVIEPKINYLLAIVFGKIRTAADQGKYSCEIQSHPLIPSKIPDARRKSLVTHLKSLGFEVEQPQEDTIIITWL